MVECIKKLEARSLDLITSISEVDSVFTALSKAPGNAGERVRVKLEKVLSKNEGFLFLKSIRQVFTGGVGTSDLFQTLTVDEILHLRYALITSTDVERSFSTYKHIFSDRRRYLQLTNLFPRLMIVQSRR